MPYEAYLGRTETRSDVVSPLLVQGLAATLDLPDPGVELPPLWHWLLFQPYAPASSLGPDGHPRRGGFMPPVDDLPRRMWAGGEVAFLAPLHVGEPVTRTSTITAIEEKFGGSGRLVFVTVRHEIAGERGPAIGETHDIVYRGSDGAAVKPAAAAPPLPTDALTRRIWPDTVLLFRYSALTANGHRIHYDQDYATRVENYPGLVVHGPLQVTLLTALAREAAGGARPARVTYRGRRPAFHDRELTLAAIRDGRHVRMQSRDDGGAVCMEGHVYFDA